MTEPDMAVIADLIGRAVLTEDPAAHAAIRREVAALVDAHPAYPAPRG